MVEWGILKHHKILTIILSRGFQIAYLANYHLIKIATKLIRTAVKDLSFIYNIFIQTHKLIGFLEDMNGLCF